MNKSNIDTQLMDQLLRVSRKLSFSHHHRHGLSRGGKGFGRTQALIMRFLETHPGTCQDEIANSIRLDKTTVAKSIKKLEELEFVSREKSELDARKNSLKLTDKAQKQNEIMKKDLANQSVETFSDLTSEEKESMKVILEKIESRMASRLNCMKDMHKSNKRIIKIIMDNEGITLEALSKECDSEQNIADCLDRLITREMIELKNGGYHPTKKAIERISCKHESKYDYHQHRTNI